MIKTQGISRTNFPYSISAKLMVWVILGITLPSVLTLIAYDCQNAATNITVISLNDVLSCPDPQVSYTSWLTPIQVLQKNQFDKIPVKTCRMEVTRLIMRCGMFSHSSIVSQSLFTYMHKVGRDGCFGIHNYQEYQGFFGHMISHLSPNSTGSASITLAGSVETDGRCKGTTYTENDRTWEDVVVTATIKYNLQDYWADVKLEQNEISLRGGVTCPLLDGYCIDAVLGETVWNPISVTDCDHYSILYSGPGRLVRHVNTSQPAHYLVVEQGDRVFALSLKSKDTMCNMKVWQTEHPKLLVTEENLQYMPQNWNRKTSKENIDLTAYINSKFLYMEQSLKTSIDRAYAYTLHRRCLLRREILRNRLVLAPLVPNMISALVKGQLGYIGKVAGEVLYILQCVPRVVEIRREDSCYIELPVRVDNESYFMAPITRVLHKYAEQTECSSLVPPLYNINNRWISFGPNSGTGIEPLTLAVDTEGQLPFSTIQSLGTGGLYTSQEIREAQQSILFGHERNAITNILTRKAVGRPVDSQGVSILSVLSAEELEKLTQSIMTRLWGWFSWLGNLTSGILGIYLLWKIIKWIISCTINMFAIHQSHGWSVKMFASFWNTLTMWLLHLKQKKSLKKTSNNRELELEGLSARINPFDDISQVSQGNQVNNVERNNTNYAKVTKVDIESEINLNPEEKSSSFYANISPKINDPTRI